mmetsp:Transcript_132901/g.230940  ORF Transcript_132901/g.230940 Transcript_132901/m.230940 type:complete len:91 (-) Transcript_132901:1823-2095(-)
MMMRSASWACSNLCVVNMTVHRSLARNNAASTARALSGSSALVGSSSKSSAGSLTRARASAMRCFCPPEREAPEAPTRVLKPSGSSWINS